MLLASKKRDHINTVRLLRVLRDKRLSPRGEGPPHKEKPGA